MKILFTHLRHFIDFTNVRGIDTKEIENGWSDLVADATTETIDERDFYSCLKKIADKVKDPLLGIKAGNFMTLKLLGLIYQISLQATTIQEAFHYLQSYLAATLPIVKAETNISKNCAIVKLEIDNKEKEINRIVLENVLAIISREVKMMAGSEVEMRLGSPFFEPDYPANWEYSPDFFISFQSVILKAALKDRSQLHLDVLLPEYLKMIGQLDGGRSFTNKVKITMLSMSDPALPDIITISDALFLTPRTLQRKLVKEAVTFREITEDLKKQICSFLMLHDPYSIASLSYILGYSEPASFIHSFKRWYGDSPQKVRSKAKSQKNL